LSQIQVELSFLGQRHGGDVVDQPLHAREL